jgi:hypothetical protein
VSLSIAETVFELPATIDMGTNSVTPFAVIPCRRPLPPRLALSSFDVHCRSNPGFDSDATEIFGSLRIQCVRCASAPAVIHSVVPRPTCAPTVPTSTASPNAVAPTKALYFFNIRCSLSASGFRLPAGSR